MSTPSSPTLSRKFNPDVRESCFDPEFKVSTEVWSISLIRAHGEIFKEPRAILVIDGLEPHRHKRNSTSSSSGLGSGYTGLPLVMEFGEQKNISWWNPENCLNVVDRATGKMIPMELTQEDIEQIKSEPKFAQKTWSISRIDALEFLWKVQNRDRLRVQFLW